MQILVSIGWIVEAQELPALNINAMAPVSMQYILKLVLYSFFFHGKSVGTLQGRHIKVVLVTNP